MQLEIVVDKSGERVLAVKGQSGQFRVPGFLSRQASQSRSNTVTAAGGHPTRSRKFNSLFCFLALSLQCYSCVVSPQHFLASSPPPTNHPRVPPPTFPQAPPRRDYDLSALKHLLL